MATELAKAYVQIVPSMEGVGSAIKSEFGSIGSEAGESSGKLFGGGFRNAVSNIADSAKNLIGENWQGTALNVAKLAGKGLLAAGGGVIKGIASGVLAGGQALASGIVSMTSQAISGFADYQQLIGGVETLFKDSADVVEQYANNAFQSAGLSANEYMQTVTGFSASLLQSLGGDTSAAAQYADMAVTDMADNANKMGTSMESIQNAYQGFARGQYTMLDNLKLGYGGTKEEMQRLLEDASAISGIEYDVSSYADVVEAIHVIQTEMGIAGTTAQEANTTIQGSLSSLGAAWQNLVAGIANPDADLGTLITNLVESAKTALTNLVPVFSQALIGIGEVIAQLAPIIAAELPGLVEQVLPSIITAATSLLTGLVAALPAILTILTEQAPMIINMLVSAIVANLPQIISAGIQLIIGLAMGLIQAIPTLVSYIPQIIMAILQGIAQGFSQIFNSGGQLTTKLGQGIRAKVSAAISAITQIWNSIKSAITGKISQALTWGRDLINNFVSGIKQKIQAVRDAVSNVASAVKSFLGFSEPDEGPLSNFHTFAPDMMKLFASGIHDNIGLVTHAVDDAAAAAMDGMTNLGAVTVNGYGRSGNTGINNVTVPEINIYTQQGQDPYAIAEQVGYVLGLQVRQKGAVYA